MNASDTSADPRAFTAADGSAHASVLNNSILGDSPEVVADDEIHACLEFIKQFHIDKKLQSSSIKALKLKGQSAWPQLPKYIRRRTKENVSNLDEKDIPTNSDLSKVLGCLTIDKQYIVYSEYLKIHSNLPSSIQQLFNPADLWGKFFNETDEHGRIEVSTFRDLFVYRINSFRYRLSLERFSYTKIGYLNFDELRTFVVQTTEQFGFFENDDDLINITTEVFAELIFFKSAGFDRDFVKITDILLCGAIGDIFNIGTDPSDNHSNYFTVACVRKCYEQYLQITGGTAPGISKKQIISTFDSVVRAFWDRYFELYCPDEYIYFVDFFKLSYMLNNLKDTNVIRLFFRVLDRDDDGVFSKDDYQPFHSQLMFIYSCKYGFHFDIDFVYDSLFDLTLAKNSINLSSIIESNRFDDFFNMACDVEGFAKLESADPLDAEANEVTSEE